MTINNTWQIHRFREKVAIYLASGETVYLTPAVAGEVAKALNACKRDISKCKFSESTFKTQTGIIDRSK